MSYVELFGCGDASHVGSNMGLQQYFSALQITGTPVTYFPILKNKPYEKENPGKHDVCMATLVS
jgi:hypothetical protein